MRYSHIVREVLARPWALAPSALSTITEVLALRASGERFTDEEIAARLRAAQQERGAFRPGTPARVGAGAGIGVLSILGMLLPRAEALERTSGATSVQETAARFRTLAEDPTVSAIVMDWDSPGGSTLGVAEFADLVHATTARKPVVAIGNAMMASAAFWIGAQATRVLATPSAVVGSIGVYSTHQNLAGALEKAGVEITLIAAGERKVDANPFEALSERARRDVQEQVDATYTQFVRAVARGRGVSVATVRDGYGQGASVLAADAKARGMVDALGTLEDAIALAAELARGGGSAARGTVGAAAAGRGTPALAAGDPDPSDPTIDWVAWAETEKLRLAARIR